MSAKAPTGRPASSRRPGFRLRRGGRAEAGCPERAASPGRPRVGRGEPRARAERDGRPPSGARFAAVDMVSSGERGRRPASRPRGTGFWEGRLSGRWSRNLGGVCRAAADRPAPEGAERARGPEKPKGRPPTAGRPEVRRGRRRPRGLRGRLPRVEVATDGRPFGRRRPRGLRGRLPRVEAAAALAPAERRFILGATGRSGTMPAWDARAGRRGARGPVPSAGGSSS